MARVLVSFSSHIFDRGAFQLAFFYEGFLGALKKCGNEVMAVNAADYLPRPWNGHNKLFTGLSGRRLVDHVQNFNPQLILAFNHSIPIDILENTECPVAVWDADSIQFYNDPEYIKKNIERYFFLCFSQAGVVNARNFGARENKVHFLLAATEVQAEDIKIDKNISFIGTNFVATDSFIKILKTRDMELDKIRSVINELNGDFYADQKAIVKKHDAEWLEDFMPLKSLAGLSAVQNRITILNNVQELGLSIYGTPDWPNVGNYLPWLAMCYNPQRIYSLQHNQEYLQFKPGLSEYIAFAGDDRLSLAGDGYHGFKRLSGFRQKKRISRICQRICRYSHV